MEYNPNVTYPSINSKLHSRISSIKQDIQSLQEFNFLQVRMLNRELWMVLSILPYPLHPTREKNSLSITNQTQSKIMPTVDKLNRT